MVKRRKARSTSSFKRKKPGRDPKALVLIVCEGKKSEPNYFKALRDDLHLTTTSVRVVESKQGSAPVNVVNYAKTLIAKEEVDYDRVFCVFDKDNHSTFNSAQKSLTNFSQRSRSKIKAIISVPCFELWLLLHFKYTTKQYCQGSMGPSACSRVIQDLEKFISNYEKASSEIYARTKDKLDTAVKNAQKLREFQKQQNGTKDPYTEVDKIVEFLRKSS